MCDRTVADGRSEQPGTADGPTLAPPGSCAATRSRSTRVVMFLALALTVGAAVFTLSAARPAPRPIRAPRDLDEIERVTASGPHAGDCERCHTTHGNAQPTVQEQLLLWPDDNTLCAQCHNTPWSGGSYAGPALQGGSAHNANPDMVWPGPDAPSRIEPDAQGKCLNCHDAHGREDASGLIPQLLLRREEKTCDACHDGSPAATNVLAEIQKPFRHPVSDFTGRHTGPLENLPEAFGTTPINRRHSECVDCHNPHVSRADATTPSGATASLGTLGASRVQVVNGAAGAAPGYVFLAGSDTLSGARAEYELCFKCHSSWTTQPSGQTDLARVLNPANPSFHPVEGAGTNPNISMLAFTPGWTPASITRCGDCHGSDFGVSRGPHGSNYEHILRRPYPASAAPRVMGSDESCFACHAYDVYANSAAPAMAREASRFNAPAITAGHAEHVMDHQVPCYACHVTHGSTTQAHLIETGRTPGILSYAETVTGGTCTPTCHGPQSYLVNYAR
jgi:predicted CXXCH cytochrome family protein